MATATGLFASNGGSGQNQHQYNYKNDVPLQFKDYTSPQKDAQQQHSKIALLTKNNKNGNVREQESSYPTSIQQINRKQLDQVSNRVSPKRVSDTSLNEKGYDTANQHHRKQPSNQFNQATASKGSIDSTSGFIANQVQNSNKNHLTKNQIHHHNAPPQNNHPNLMAQQIKGFYNTQVTPKNHQRQNLQESLSNTASGFKTASNNQMHTLQNSKQKNIFNHFTNQKQSDMSSNNSQSTQLTSQRLAQHLTIALPQQQHQILLKNIKIKRSQQQTDKFQGSSTVLLDSSNQKKQGGGIDNIVMVQPQTTKNKSGQQFTTTIFSNSKGQNAYSNLNNLLQEQNMKQQYNQKGEEQSSSSVRQSSSKRSQKTQDRIIKMMQTYDSPKPDFSNQNINRDDYSSQARQKSLSPKQQALQKQVMQNHFKLLQGKFNFTDGRIFNKNAQKQHKILKKNFSLTGNNLNSLKSPSSSQAQQQSNLLKFFHQSKQNKQTSMNGIQMNFSNILSNINNTQDSQQQQQQYLNQKHQQLGSQNLNTLQQHQLQQLSTDNCDANQYYYQLSNKKKKQQLQNTTDRRVHSSYKLGRNGANLLSKRDTPLSLNSRKSSGNNNGSNKKPSKRRASSQIKNPQIGVFSSFSDDLVSNQLILDQQNQILSLQQEIGAYQNELEQAQEKPEMKSQSTDLQHSFEKQKKDKLMLKIKSYRHDLTLYQDQLTSNAVQEKDKFIEEFSIFLNALTEDSLLFGQDSQYSPLQELLRDAFKLYSDYFKYIHSQRQTQQNISPSAYEILKQDYDKLQREYQTSKDKLRLTQDFNQGQRKEVESMKKKLEERDQMIIMMQDTFEKELDNLYSETDVKKFARELNVLYEQNQELHKMNKRMKYELRQAQERERQFIKIIKKSPELVRMLDLEDSSILDSKVPAQQIKPQEILVSSKLVPITKLDLDKVTEIQKLQAQGTLPPLEESKLIDKKQLRDDVKDMIIQDDDLSDPSILDIEHRKKQVIDSQKENGGAYEDYDSEDLDGYGLEEDEEEKEDFQEIYVTQNMKDEGSSDINNRCPQKQQPGYYTDYGDEDA